MKRTRTSDSAAPAAYVRHYHRTDGTPRVSWDQWVDGGETPRRPRFRKLKVAAAILAGLALAAVIVALIFELRPA